DDNSYHITPERAPFKDQLLAIDPGFPTYDAVSRFGDEIAVPVFLGPDSSITVNRTGIPEKDIVNYDSRTIKLGAGIYYQPEEDLKVSYDVRYFQGDGILRHTTVYPLRNIAHFMQKLEVKGKDFFIRAYHSQEDANDSYAILGTGAFIQEGLKSSVNWSQDYGLALRGEIPGISAGDHTQARLFADRDIPGPESDAFQALRTASLTNPDVLSGGSLFIDKSGLVHVEAMYDFGDKVKYFDLQEGVIYRRYFLNSEGNLFNDGALGFNSQIPVEEYGAFVQASRTWWEDRISMRASVRFDKNQNFEGRLSPRIGLVVTPDKNRKHYIRLSAQSGFRNPSPQETYISLDIGDAIILGGTQDNIDRYQYQLSDGALVPGDLIHQNLVSLQSVQAFLGTGGTDLSLLDPLRLDYLRQEQISTAELGYRGVLGRSLY
ncbi:MAG: TonB-dependent receptor, partial [Bacteroidota bacterium]